MNRIFKIALLSLFSAFSLISCNKDDAAKVFPPTPYAEQYPVDLANIDKFLDEYHMDVSTDKDVTFTKIPNPNSAGLATIRAEFITPYPIADRTKTVTRDGIDYKIYFIPLDQGLGDKPTVVDSVLVAYKGDYLYKKTDEVIPSTNPKTYTTYIANAPFDQAQNAAWFSLSGVVAGWKEILPLFKAANNHTQNGDGTMSYSGYGAGVMFLPSAFGYYNNSVSVIPAYSPLIFSFKLMGLNYVDNDFDRIDSKDEDMNGNGILSDDDTDGDGHSNYLDQDDDGDGFFTKYEIARPKILVNGVLVGNGYYPYNGAATDDPSTPNIDETQGIPRKFTGPIDPITHLATPGPGDFTDPLRLRRHLDRTCTPPFE